MPKKVTATFEVAYEILVADKEDVQEVVSDIGNVLEYQTTGDISGTLGDRIAGCECVCVIEISTDAEEEDEDSDEESFEEEAE